MRFLFLLVITAISIISGTALTQAAAAPPATFETIRSHAEFMKLSKSDRATYLVGLELLVNDIASYDAQEKTEYQASNFDRGSNFWVGALLETATAAPGDRRCVYAGNISEMDINGRYCMRPRDQGCAPKVTCNPLIYGSGRCASAGKSASQLCAQSAKPLAVIIKELEGKKAEWDAYRKEVGGYCESPRPTQKRVCAAIVSRVSRVEAILGRAPTSAKAAEPAITIRPVPRTAAPAAAPVAETIAIKPVTPAANPPAIKAASSAEQPAAASTVSVAPTNGVIGDAQSVQPLTGVGKGICTRSFLSSDLKNDKDPSALGLSLMTVGESKDFMCTAGTIRQSWINSVRNMLRYKLAQVPTLDQRYRNNEKLEVLQRSENFEACLGDALKIRAGKNVSEPYSRSGSIVVNGSIATFFSDSRQNIGATDVTNIGAWMENQQLSLCKTQINVPNVNAPRSYPGISGGSKSAN